MLNPFIHLLPPEKRQKPTLDTEESIAQTYGHSLDTASPHPSVGLLVGKLLIKMGEKLANQDQPMKSTRENE